MWSVVMRMCWAIIMLAPLAVTASITGAERERWVPTEKGATSGIPHPARGSEDRASNGHGTTNAAWLPQPFSRYEGILARMGDDNYTYPSTTTTLTH